MTIFFSNYNTGIFNFRIDDGSDTLYKCSNPTYDCRFGHNCGMINEEEDLLRMFKYVNKWYDGILNTLKDERNEDEVI
jgi:hypothetical protein